MKFYLLLLMFSTPTMAINSPVCVYKCVKNLMTRAHLESTQFLGDASTTTGLASPVSDIFQICKELDSVSDGCVSHQHGFKKWIEWIPTERGNR